MTLKCALLVQSASISLAVLPVPVLRVTTVMHITDFAHQRKENAPLIKNAARMKNVCSQVNAYAHHLSFWTPTIITNVRALVNVFLVASTPSVHQRIHHSVCVNQASKEIRSWAVQMKMNVRTCLALTVLIALIKKAAISVFVPKALLVIHIKAVAYWKLARRRAHVQAMRIVRVIWHAWRALAYLHVPVYFAVPTLFVRQKITRAGVAVASVIAKIQMATVYRNVRTSFAAKEHSAYLLRKDQPVNAHTVTLVIRSQAVRAQRISAVHHARAPSDRFVSMVAVRNAVMAWYVALVPPAIRPAGNVFANPTLLATQTSCVCHLLNMLNVIQIVVRMLIVSMVSAVVHALAILAPPATPMKDVVYRAKICAHPIVVARMLNVALMVNKLAVSVHKASPVMRM